MRKLLFVFATLLLVFGITTIVSADLGDDYYFEVFNNTNYDMYYIYMDGTDVLGSSILYSGESFGIYVDCTWYSIEIVDEDGDTWIDEDMWYPCDDGDIYLGGY